MTAVWVGPQAGRTALASDLQDRRCVKEIKILRASTDIVFLLKLPSVSSRDGGGPTNDPSKSAS